MTKEYQFAEGVRGVLAADGTFTYFVSTFADAYCMHQVVQVVIDAQAQMKAERDALKADAGKLPKEPSLGLLVSMAMRLDHSLFAPHPSWTIANYDGAIRTMRQLYEEVSGHGFWSPENDSEYVANFEACRQSLRDGEKHASDI